MLAAVLVKSGSHALVSPAAFCSEHLTDGVGDVGTIMDTLKFVEAAMGPILR